MKWTYKRKTCVFSHRMFSYKQTLHIPFSPCPSNAFYFKTKFPLSLLHLQYLCYFYDVIKENASSISLSFCTKSYIFQLVGNIENIFHEFRQEMKLKILNLFHVRQPMALWFRLSKLLFISTLLSCSVKFPLNLDHNIFFWWNDFAVVSFPAEYISYTKEAGHTFETIIKIQIIRIHKNSYNKSPKTFSQK